MQSLTHTFVPIYDENSRILILGTFPSVKSRENQFYYGHPQNRFWKVTAALAAGVGQNAGQTGAVGKMQDGGAGAVFVPQTIEEKKAMLLKSRIAIWDVIASCEIEGSSDSSIRNVVPNDIPGLLAKSNIQAVFCNGGKAYELYVKYCEKPGGRKAVKLPSTSPANASWSLERLTASWREAVESYLF